MADSKIRDYIYSQKQDMVDFLSEIVEIKSITCNEKEVVDRVDEKMKELGYDEIIRDSFGNVIGKIGKGAKALVFDSHLDVVDAEGQDWATDPFKAVIKDGKIFGRGTVDDKGPFVASLYAGKAAIDLDLCSQYTVYVVGSIVEEDCEGLALGAFLEEYDILPDQVVIAESSELEICRGHRGRAQVRATFAGMPVHASRHREGVNPIVTASDFLKGLDELDYKLADVAPLGKGNVAPVDVRCESNSLSTTPTETKILMDRRTNTGDTRESILKELASLPGGESCRFEYVEWEAEGYNGYAMKGEEFFPAWALDEEHPLIQAGVKAFRDFSDEEPVVTTWGFSTNGNYTMGKKGYPTIGFGPGEMALCHGPDEHLAIEDLVKAAGFYAQLIKTLNDA